MQYWPTMQYWLLSAHWVDFLSIFHFTRHFLSFPQFSRPLGCYCNNYVISFNLNIMPNLNVQGPNISVPPRGLIEIFFHLSITMATYDNGTYLYSGIIFQWSGKIDFRDHTIKYKFNQFSNILNICRPWSHIPITSKY